MIENDLIEVFTAELWKAEMIKNILEDNGIYAFIKNEYIGSIVPWYISAGGGPSISVFISKEYYKKAITLIEEFESNPY